MGWTLEHQQKPLRIQNRRVQGCLVLLSNGGGKGIAAMKCSPLGKSKQIPLLAAVLIVLCMPLAGCSEESINASFSSENQGGKPSSENQASSSESSGDASSSSENQGGKSSSGNQAVSGESRDDASSSSESWAGITPEGQPAPTESASRAVLTAEEQCEENPTCKLKEYKVEKGPVEPQAPVEPDPVPGQQTGEASASETLPPPTSSGS